MGLTIPKEPGFRILGHLFLLLKVDKGMNWILSPLVIQRLQSFYMFQPLISIGNFFWI
jgi:hypothetical protein